jgi:hypothetical protein
MDDLGREAGPPSDRAANKCGHEHHIAAEGILPGFTLTCKLPPHGDDVKHNYHERGSNRSSSYGADSGLFGRSSSGMGGFSH